MVHNVHVCSADTIVRIVSLVASEWTNNTLGVRANGDYSFSSGAHEYAPAQWR
jgi:uncharacterized protein YaiE (UPF0345 family)